MTHRIRGKIKVLSKESRIFGVIIGDDLRDYFFIPSFLRVPTLFQSLECEAVVEFTPRSTEKGMRAWNVSVLNAAERSHGEESLVR